MGRPATHHTEKGNRHGRLTVLKVVPAEKKGGSRMVKTSCDCGNLKMVAIADLCRGATQSCGCLRNERVKAAISTHGQSRTPLYAIWCNIIARCYNKDHPRYDSYGGRGIRMSKRWRHSFEAFAAGMGPRPSPDHSGYRRDNDKGYSKANCRWATNKQQNSNKRNSFLITYKGKTRTASAWGRIKKLPAQALIERIRLGWSVHDTLTKELRVVRSEGTKRGMKLKAMQV